MPADNEIICAFEVAPGEACGHRLAYHIDDPEEPACPWCWERMKGDEERRDAALHAVIPGQTCRVCGGNRRQPSPHSSPRYHEPCPHCIGGVERIEEAAHD